MYFQNTFGDVRKRLKANLPRFVYDVTTGIIYSVKTQLLFMRNYQLHVSANT